MQNAQRIAVQIHVEASTHTRPSIYPTAKTTRRPFIPGNFSIAKLSFLLLNTDDDDCGHSNC